MRSWGFLFFFAAVLLGCAHADTKVQRQSEVDYSSFRRIGVMPFTDPRGQGRLIAEGVDAGLRRLMYESADMKTLEAILAAHKPDRQLGLTLEALMDIRAKTSADAIVFGAMAPDWREASILLVDVESGEQVLTATLRPSRGGKAFTDPDEVIQETARVFAALVAGKTR